MPDLDRAWLFLPIGYLFSILIAAVLSLMVPLGTILAIFTIQVLLRRSVGKLYSARSQHLI